MTELLKDVHNLFPKMEGVIYYLPVIEIVHGHPELAAMPPKSLYTHLHLVSQERELVVRSRNSLTIYKLLCTNSYA